MDDLPVEFPECVAGAKIDPTTTKTAISALVHDIWKVGGFRFAYKDIQSGRYRYFCNQDKDVYERHRGNGLRDAPQMNRFQCKSLLRLYPCFKTHILQITLKHHYHSPYIDRSITPELVKFIELRAGAGASATAGAAESTPDDILREAQSTDLPGCKRLTINQVSYQWQKLKSGLSSRDEEPFEKLSTDTQIPVQVQTDTQK